MTSPTSYYYSYDTWLRGEHTKPNIHRARREWASKDLPPIVRFPVSKRRACRAQLSRYCQSHLVVNRSRTHTIYVSLLLVSFFHQALHMCIDQALVARWFSLRVSLCIFDFWFSVPHSFLIWLGARVFSVCVQFRVHFCVWIELDKQSFRSNCLRVCVMGLRLFSGW